MVTEILESERLTKEQEEPKLTCVWDATNDVVLMLEETVTRDVEMDIIDDVFRILTYK